jgi:hypothetical protein
MAGRLLLPGACLPLLLGLVSCDGRPASTPEEDVESGVLMLTATEAP